jgi:hypothetical protein
MLLIVGVAGAVMLKALLVAPVRGADEAVNV